MEKTTPHFTLTVHEDAIFEGALTVLAQIRPKWTTEQIELKLLTDGITNKLVGCRYQDETVLVRIYGNKTDLLIDRKAETRNIQLLSKVSLAPSLYATFNNGLAYEFVPGCTLTSSSVIEPKIYKLIATKMAKLHKVQVPDENTPKACIWNKLQDFLDLVPETFSDFTKNERFLKMNVPKSQLQKELDFLKQKLQNTKSKIVFCHNDLLLGNVIYTEATNSVTFIDFEYAAHNYQAFDIANHFLEFAGLENVNFGNYPETEFQFEWFRIYLKEFQDTFTQDDLFRLYEQVQDFVLVSHLFWGIWALIQTEHSYIKFDFLGYGEIRLKEYFSKKRVL